MNNQSLIIYESNLLYDIFNELADHLPFSIIQLTKKELLKLNRFKTRDYLVVSEKKIQNISNQIVIDKFPLNIFKLIERNSVF